MNYTQFHQKCRRLVEGESSHGVEYLNIHSHRLYVTYDLLSGRLSPGDRVLSIGPGPCFVEVQLIENSSIDLTVVDHPRTAERNEVIYDEYGIEHLSVDVATEDPDGIDGRFDCVIACEILEHLPITVSEFVGKIEPPLAPDGFCLISTPNVASLYNVFTLAQGENVYDDDRHMFDPEGHGYEPHLREYTATELVRALGEHGFERHSVVYCENRRLRDQFRDNVSTWSTRAALLVVYLMAVRLVPRFRKTVLVLGERAE